LEDFQNLLEIFLAHWGRFLSMIALLGLSFFFSSSETALFSLTRLDFDQLKRRGGAGANAALQLMKDPQGLLAAVLLGNLLVNISFYAISTVLTIELSRKSSLWAIVASLSSLLAVVFFGEILAKFTAISSPIKISRSFAPPLRYFYQIIGPVRMVLAKIMTSMEGRIIVEPPHLEAEELSDLVELAGSEGTLGEHERRLVQEAVDLAELRVSHIMIPRVDIQGCEHDMPASSLLLTAARTGHAKFPVFGEGVDDILGIVDVIDALNQPAVNLKALSRPAKFVPEQKMVTELLAEFEKERTDFAIVSDEFGGTAGLVTLEDIVEEVVGDIREPHERLLPAEIQKLSETSYLLAGDLPADAWAEAIGIDPDDLGADRLGGLVTSLLGRIPHEGDTVRRGGLSFTVRKMRRRRVTLVLLELANEETADEIDELDELENEAEVQAEGDRAEVDSPDDPPELPGSDPEVDR
jgi:magnesium and cobalt exporter, CNNM family